VDAPEHYMQLPEGNQWVNNEHGEYAGFDVTGISQTAQVAA